MKGGGSGAQLAGIVYEPRLTLDLPRSETGGTAMNALAHAAEALYTTTRDPSGDEDALTGAALIAEALPAVLDAPHDLEPRTRLLRGAAHAGAALGVSFMGLAHAVAQALGGRYGLPHGAMNALVLAPTLRRLLPANASGEYYLTDAIGVLHEAGYRVTSLVAQDPVEAAGQLGGPAIEATVDVDLLVHGGAVTAVLLHALAGHDLHRCQDLAGQLAAADGVERQRGAGLAQRAHEILEEGGRAGADHVFCAQRAQRLLLLGAAHDVHQADLILLTDAHQHLPQIRRSRGVHQRARLRRRQPHRQHRGI